MEKLRIEEMERLSVEDYREAEKRPLQVLCDNIRSLQNVGSVFRTADAFLLEKVWLCGITGQPPHREINKSALGATESVSWEYREDALTLATELAKQGKTLLALEQAKGSTPLEKFQAEKGKEYVLVLGNEVEGVQQSLIDLCQACLEIPQYGTKHSLNVSVSAGIALWHLSRQLS